MQEASRDQGWSLAADKRASRWDEGMKGPGSAQDGRAHRFSCSNLMNRSVPVKEQDAGRAGRGRHGGGKGGSVASHDSHLTSVVWDCLAWNGTRSLAVPLCRRTLVRWFMEQRIRRRHVHGRRRVTGDCFASSLTRLIVGQSTSTTAGRLCTMRGKVGLVQVISSCREALGDVHVEE